MDNLSIRERTLVLLAVSTGLRQSEIFGLKWEDIDFTQGNMSVTRSIVYGVVGPWRAGHSGSESRELSGISDKYTKGCKFVSFCTLAGFMKMSVKSLFRMAGTTRLELATSAVTSPSIPAITFCSKQKVRTWVRLQSRFFPARKNTVRPNSRGYLPQRRFWTAVLLSDQPT